MSGYMTMLIKDLVTTKYGKAKWVQILDRAKLEDNFLTHDKYPMETFHKLASGCCEYLKMTLDEFLEVF